MKSVLEQIEMRKEQLEKNPFCEWIKTANPKTEDPFSFTPAMLYFVLGFKDILNSIKVKNPETVWEHTINMHCEEDANHWLWYLRDLEVLGFQQNSWGQSWTDIFKQIWADDHAETREMVYLCIHLTRTFNHPLVSLAIIECLEAAFGVFIDGVKQQAKNCGVYEKLQYFGKTHNDKEHDHSLGNWIEGQQQNTELSEEVLNEDVQQLALFAVQGIFDQFEKIFENWYQHRSSFSREAAQELQWRPQGLPDADGFA